jgi:hypothetical protein
MKITCQFYRRANLIDLDLVILITALSTPLMADLNGIIPTVHRAG